MKLPSKAFLAFALLLLLNLNGSCALPARIHLQFQIAGTQRLFLHRLIAALFSPLDWSCAVCPVESARPQGLGTGHHPPGEGHHPPGEGHHHDHDHDGNGGHKDGHKHKHKHHHHDEEYDGDGYSFYVFGDSFADNGNLPSKNDQWPELTRQWHEPYSSNGRFSNKEMVQSDFIANMLGQSESPPAHMVTSHVGQTGMNFAAGGAGVFEVRQGVPTLGEQVHAFHKLVKAKKIKKEHLVGNSVALVAISGNDYARVGVVTSGFVDVNHRLRRQGDYGDPDGRCAAAGNRCGENNLFPVGCAPSQTRPSNHTTCEEQGNQGASLHNKYLGDKLADKEGVLVLDISAAFTEIIGNHGDGRGELAHKFGHKLTPCCESVDPKGYCGQRAYDEYSEIYSTYSVCDEPNGYFFWDDMNPTQAGWAAVMGQLESPIKEFLDLD
ncbi:hypothetical protein ACQ4PT_031079 [Festuca glaucescens]